VGIDLTEQARLTSRGRSDSPDPRRSRPAFCVALRDVAHEIAGDPMSTEGAQRRAADTGERLTRFQEIER
jgi:hypothetical protein